MSKPTLAIYGIQDRADRGYPWYVHDHALALMQDGKVEKHIQLERISRKKRDNSLHKQLFSILKKEKLLKTDFDLVFVDNVVGRSFITTGGEIRFEAPLNNTLASGLEKGRAWWLDHEVEAYCLNHELAHVFSNLPFCGELMENSLLIHFDGGASRSNFSAWTWKDGKINYLESHWDLKYLSSLYNANALSFEIIGADIRDQNAVPGKLMGYASYGDHSQELENWLIKNNYFENIWGSKKIFFAKLKSDFGIEIKHFDQKETVLMDIAATFQHIFQRETVKKIVDLQEQTQTDYLYYSGGSALNIPVNSAILASRSFRDLFIPPCTDDSGLALGAAAFFEWQKHGTVKKNSPYLNNWGVEQYKASYTMDDIRQVAHLLQQGSVLGVCNEQAEVGPRALGNRSILSLANSKKLADRVSMDIKGREWYRPVAPIMLDKNLTYFTGKQNVHHLAKHMLLNFEILPEHRKELAGATHVDGTSRVQVLSAKDDNPFMFDLLSYLDRNNGIKALINTSFNKRGEPIVHTEEDAIRSAKNIGLDALVLNGRLEYW